MSYSADSSVGIEVWLPVQWNGRFLGTGNVGYAGEIVYEFSIGPLKGLADGLRAGYAVANTDMGTGYPSGDEGAPQLIGHPVRWLDFGQRSTHGMTVAAKQLIRAFYGRSPEYSYFNGCSTGGMQGLMEAQKYPGDYDGILAGAPGNNRARIHVSLLWNYAVAKTKLSRTLTEGKLRLIHHAVLSACSTLPFSFVDDPPRCQWRPEALRCKTADTSQCLTPDEIETVNMLYDGPRNQHTGEQIFPGLPRGTELGWKAYMEEARNPAMPFAGVFRWVFGPDWRWNTFDYYRDTATFETVLTPFFVATNPDLSPFKANGGKLLMYYGWADWLSSAYDGINYYQSVVEKMRPPGADHRAALRATQEFFRLFMMPGVDHCAGGTGADRFDGLGALFDWVEKGVNPARIVASSHAEGAIRFTRPLCPYPQVARYIGAGDIDNAANFECKD
jgi:feruloyl esterase